MTVWKTLVGNTLRVLSGATKTIVPPGYVSFDVSVDASQNGVLNWSLPRFYGGAAVTGWQITVDGVPTIINNAATRSYTATLSGPGTYIFGVAAISSAGTGPVHTQSVSFGSSSPNTLSPPSSISDGTNRTAEFLAWIATVPDGSVIDLTGRSIRCNESLDLTGRNGLTIKNGTVFTDDPTGYGNYKIYADNTAYITTDVVLYKGDSYHPVVNFTSGTTIPPAKTSFVATDWKRIGGANGNDPRVRSHWNISDCAGLTFSGHTVRGANTTGIYNASLEAQTAFNIHGCSNVLIENCTATQVFGDFVTTSPLINLGAVLALPNLITIRNLYGRLDGRQGIAITAGTNIIVELCDLDQLARSAFDLEPTSPTWTIDTVHIQNNRIGTHKLNFLSSLGAAAPVNNIYVTGNTGVGDTIGGSIGQANYRRSNWTFSNNASDTPQGTGAGAAVSALNIDGIIIQNNVCPVDNTHTVYMLKATNCTGIVCNGNSGANLAGQYVEV